jgi:hypothetical protein
MILTGVSNVHNTLWLSWAFCYMVSPSSSHK